MNLEKPRIGIPVPTSRDLEYNQRSWKQYAAAVAEAGGVAVEVPLGTDAVSIRELAGSCDGFCLPGSPADVDPARYGAGRDPATAEADVAREAVDFALLDHAATTEKPVLGICFGVQSMNVWAGGTLVQDLLRLPVNHSAGGSVAVAHTVLVAETSGLGGLLGREEAPESSGFWRLPVNTSHHQAVGVPGDGLRIVARCPDDGVAEAVELDTESAMGPHSRWMLGVQWHPERSVGISAASRALFAKLVAEAAAGQDKAK